MVQVWRPGQSWGSTKPPWCGRAPRASRDDIEGLRENGHGRVTIQDSASICGLKPEPAITFPLGLT